MPRVFRFEGKTYSLPDGVSDKEALEFIDTQHPAPPPAERPGFWETMGKDVMGQVKGAWDTVRHPTDTPFNQMLDFSSSITPAERAAHHAKHNGGFIGPPTPVPPPPAEVVPGWGETAAHQISPFVLPAAMGAVGELTPWARVGAGVRAAAPDVGMGAVKVGAGAAAAHTLPHEASYMLGYPIYKGGKQIVEGVGKGVKAFRDYTPPVEMPAPWADTARPSGAKFEGGIAPPPPAMESIPATQTPSGRSVPTAEERMARASVPVAPAPVPAPPVAGVDVQNLNKPLVNTGAAPGSAPAPAIPPTSSGDMSIPTHDTVAKHSVDADNKVKNLSEYLRSKGGTAEHLDQIVKDPALTRQFLDEAQQYGAAKGNPVPKRYGGLDEGTSSHQRTRQALLDMIEAEKNK